MDDPVEVIYTPDIFLLQRFGGISRYYVETIRRLHAAGQKVNVVAGLHRNEYLRPLRGVTTGLYYPYKVGPLHRLRVAFNEALCRSIIRRRPRAVVHQTYYSDARYPHRGPVVATVYDLIHEKFHRRFPELNDPNDPVVASLRSTCLRADHLIAISATTRDDLVECFGIDANKITVVHLASALPAPGAPLPAQPAQKADSPAAPYLLYVGMRAGYKNFASLLEAYGRSPSLRASYRLLCFGGPPFDSTERGRLEEMHLTDRVTHQPGGDEVLLRCYREATAFVCPSLYEGFGLPILEAMSQGCPVFSARAGSLPEVGGAAAVYFDPREVDALRKALEATLPDGTTLARMREAGFRQAALFSWERCARETLAVYRRVCR